MERKTIFGTVYKNEKLGISEDIYPHNAFFVPEGKEHQIAEGTWIIGRVESFKEGVAGQIIIKDSQGIIFVSQDRAKRYKEES